MMKRRPVNRANARRSFVRRASKTNRVNMMAPLRGGIRL